MQRQRLRAMEYGVIRPPRGKLGERLRAIYTGIADLVEKYRPAEVAIERAFVHINPASALALGQARGAALAAAMVEPCEYAEYAPRAVKLAIVGSGKADKSQVAHMVRHLLKLAGPIAEDASDALAIAVCHAHSRNMDSRLLGRK
ncbi:MAG: crossover junction endodeoxyribonuclease RuvC [Gammaproteobacteria bacterium]|nr:crossover junction endodeoxyribonuclease RuvC [Gammaproteobacteria bacterium]